MWEFTVQKFVLLQPWFIVCWWLDLWVIVDDEDPQFLVKEALLLFSQNELKKGINNHYNIWTL